MYNVVVFSGGTGSIAIQKGFSAIFGQHGLNFDIIINAYDNGLSTGACRKVFDDKILGPSDLRKNQMTQFSLQKERELSDWWSRESVLYRLFQLRFDADCKESYYQRARELLTELEEAVGEKDATYLRALLDHFFFEDVDRHTWRATLDGIEFDDFSLANVFYSAAASLNGNSLRAAGTDMAQFLGIKDNVHLISDVNLYLQARTNSGLVIADEGDIVTWDNLEDKIASIELLKNGKIYSPEVDEETDILREKSCRDIVAAADIIIFSSGTQWSSLIPTYVHRGFREMIEASNARKYLVINTSEDHDMWGVSADETVDVLRRFLPLDDVTAVVNTDAPAGLNRVESIRSIEGHIGAEVRKHNPIGLVRLIMLDYFGISNFKGTFFFDLDGTLFDETESGVGKSVGAENMNLFHGVIHSGNNYEHVRSVLEYLYWRDDVVDVYSDYGNVHFTNVDYQKTVISDRWLIHDDVVSALNAIPEFAGKVSMRGEGCVVTIKPLNDRNIMLQKAKAAIEQFGDKYEAHIAGNTSIDVVSTGYDKKAMLQTILSNMSISPSDVVFVGNEVERGAESTISETGVRTLQVNDVFECNVLLRTLSV